MEVLVVVMRPPCRTFLKQRRALTRAALDAL
jgi:hypothetical protein